MTKCPGKSSVESPAGTIQNNGCFSLQRQSSVLNRRSSADARSQIPHQDSAEPIGDHYSAGPGGLNVGDGITLCDCLVGSERITRTYRD